jgi:uncharacterized protein YceH (UPF0502 family)
MSNPLAERIPPRYLPLVALVAGRPDAAAVHLAAQDRDRVDVNELRAEVDHLRAEVAQLREELGAALEFVDRLSEAHAVTES